MNKKLLDELKETNLLDGDDGLRDVLDEMLNCVMEGIIKGLKTCDSFDQELLEDTMFMNDLTIWVCMTTGKMFNDKAMELQSDYVIDFLPGPPEEGEEE